MAKINGVNHTVSRAQIFNNAGGFDTMSKWNYIMDDFTNIHFYYNWPMVDTEEEVLADFDRIITTRKLKIVEPTKTTLKKWQKTKH